MDSDPARPGLPPASSVSLESYTAVLIVCLVVLLVFSAFFSASETAFSSLNRIRLKHLAAGNSRRAKLALKLLEGYDKLLSTVLIGNNIVNIASSAIGTVIFVGFFGNAGVSLATLVMTVLVLFFGEISPKTLAKEFPEKIAMAFAPALSVLVLIFSPANRLVSRWKRCIIRIFPARGGHSVTEDELLTFVEEVREEGGINRQEEEMIRQVIEFDDITAGEIYTPRVDVAAIPEDAGTEAIDGKFFETGYSRLPVYRDSIDNITGVMLLKDFHHEVIRRGKCPAGIVKPVVYITKSMKVSRLLRTLQEKKSHLAVLVDEFGGTMGIVTIEDIVEELVGEIWDEHDEVVENIFAAGDGSFRVRGNTDLKELFAFLSLAPPWPETASATVGNWVTETLGGIPREGESFACRDLRFTVSRVLRHRVMEAVVRRTGGGHGDGEA
ncbi:MAG: hemolysin family protein [Treponema sp.]|jgi:CBS domain containing-hemolysin-like protein|nr:hemolysin family protein [Treponema sp.]